MKIHQMEPEHLFQSLNTRSSGLTVEEADFRLKEFGLNAVKHSEKPSLVWIFVKELTHFFAIILWLASGLAFYADYLQPNSGMSTVGLAIIGVIFINGLFSFWQEYKADVAISALEKLIPRQTKCLRNNEVTLIPVETLVPGDIILLQVGDLIPADCRLIETTLLRVNNSTITGESAPLLRDNESSQVESLYHARNILFAGTSVVSGSGKAAVFATGLHSELGKLAHLTYTTSRKTSHLLLEISRLSKLIACLASFLGALFFLIGHLIGLTFWDNFIFAIGIIVANVPEGLLPTVTLSLAMATQRMAKSNALVRHLPSVETLGAATVICTDKTGTLTMNTMEVSECLIAQKPYDLNAPSSLLQDTLNSHPHFFDIAYHCHNLQEVSINQNVQMIGDPMESSLVNLVNKLHPSPPNYTKIFELSFDSERKRLSTLHQTEEKSIILFCKGALEKLLPICSFIEEEDQIINLTNAAKLNLLSYQEKMASNGLRVIAFAWRNLANPTYTLQDETSLTFCGLVGLKDPPRPEVKPAIAACHRAGIKVIMITGDHPKTAFSIASEIGLIKTDQVKLITGDQLQLMTNTQLQLALDHPDIIFARVAADQKMRIVASLQKKKHVVAVTGDGVNDAPALKLADIGIAMGLSGTDVAKEAADLILMDDNFASIVKAIEEGRTVFQNIRKFLIYILTSTIPEALTYLCFALFKIPLPLTVIQILTIDLGTNMLPAIGLGVDPPQSDIMEQRPRQRHERLVTWKLLMKAYAWLGLIESAVALLAYGMILTLNGWKPGMALSTENQVYQMSTTACLVTIITLQIANVLICKCNDRSLMQTPLTNNPLLIYGVLLEILLIILIVYTPLGHSLLSTYPLPYQFWLWLLPFPLLMMGLEELRKWLFRP